MYDRVIVALIEKYLCRAVLIFSQSGINAWQVGFGDNFHMLRRKSARILGSYP